MLRAVVALGEDMRALDGAPAFQPDDTLGTIKAKLVSSLGVAPAEMYLFGEFAGRANAHDAYLALSQGGTQGIPQARLASYLSNVSPVDVSALAPRRDYAYDDLLAVDLSTVDTVLHPAGIGFNLQERYPVAANPFDVVEVDPFLAAYAGEITSSRDQALVMSLQGLKTPQLYVVTASSVVAYAEAKGLSGDALLRIYFPMLAALGIDGAAALAVRSPELLAAALDDVERERPRWAAVALLHRVVADAGARYPRTAAGITSLACVIHPIAPTVVPLEALFKLMRTSPEMPAVKYNAGPRLDKLYRLRAGRVAQSGRRVPDLTKTKLARIAATTARERAVSAYIATAAGELVVQFTPDGDVGIVLTPGAPLGIPEAAAAISQVVNPLLVQLNLTLRQSGYEYAPFDGFGQRVEVLAVDYKEVLEVPGVPDLGGAGSCASAAFTIVEPSIAKTAQLTLVRVGYYNKMSALDQFITTLSQREVPPSDIVARVAREFDVDAARAREAVGEWLNNVQVEQNAFRNKRLKVRSSGGVPVTISRDQFTSSLVVTAMNMPALGYIASISTYVEALVRLGQPVPDTTVPRKELAKVCAAGSDVAAPAPAFGSARANALLPADDPELVIRDNLLVFEDDADDGDDLLDELYGEDEDFDMTPSPTADPAPKANSPAPKANSPAPKANSPAPKANSPAPKANSPVTEVIDGMPLSNPNYFFDRLHRRDPAIFLKSGDGRYKAYSRICPHNLRRQPVVLTDAEKERIDRENPGAYPADRAIRYGSSPDKMHWYICPRYWCMKTDTPLTQAQVDAGECGGKIIPFDAKTVPPGHYIFEFNQPVTNNEHIDADGNYVQHYPGFISSDVHPKGLCVPCCFKSWDKKNLVARRAACAVAAAGDTGPMAEPGRGSGAPKEPAKFPLRAGESGYLPAAIAAVLETDNTACYANQQTRALKRHQPCLLRAGVEQSENQSFLAAVGAAADPPMDIAAVKARLAQVITPAVFASLQNGSLIGAFSDGARGPGWPHVDRARERFVAYLQSKDTHIDYSYLWDVVCLHFYDKPVSLLVLDMPDDDTTDNVDLVCPSGGSNSTVFSPRAPYLVVARKNGYFEPIFKYTDKAKGPLSVSRLLAPDEPGIARTTQAALRRLAKLVGRCAPTTSYDPRYVFQPARRADQSRAALAAANIEVLSQVANYNGQIVALKTRAGYVPTSPSGSAPDVPTTQIDNPKNWAGYGTTVGTLRDVARRTGLPVAPKAKVLEGGLVVGILVESGQFVQLSVPAEDTVNDGLMPVSTGDPVAADQATFAETGEDTERTDMTRRIALEGQYFAAFRNTLRYVLSRAEHVAVRKRVEALVASHAPYLERLRDIDALLREVGQPYVRFAEFGETGTAAATKVAMCASLSDCSSSANCISAGGTCVLVAPLRHLITGGPNEDAYYGRVADELVRYPRARRYILDRGEYLQIGALNYDLAPDEIVVLGGVLFGQYFNGLVALPPNPYTTAPTYEDVVTAQSADAAVEVVDLRGAAQVSGCVGATRPLGSTEKWWHLLPSDTYIVPYTPAALCGFELVAAIASDMTGELISQSMLRDELARGYEDLLKAQNLGGLVRTLRAQKKNDIAA